MTGVEWLDRAVAPIGRPEGLEPAERRVHRAGDEGVEVLHEGGETAVDVGDDHVAVIRGDAERVDEDIPLTIRLGRRKKRRSEQRRVTRHSDLDILVYFEKDPTFLSFIGLKAFLEDHLATRSTSLRPMPLKPRMRPIVELEAVDVAQG